LYNSYMDIFLEYVSETALFVAAVIVITLVVSLVTHFVSHSHYEKFHQPLENEDGKLFPRHPHCFQCEDEVEKLGGEPQGHSSME